jgi:hypothetical protein
MNERGIRGLGHYLRWVAGNVLLRLADAAGVLAFVVRNSDGDDVLVVDSQGNLQALGNVLGNQTVIVDGITAPSTLSGYAQIYVDTADGDLKVKFGDGTVAVIAADT